MKVPLVQSNSSDLSRLGLETLVCPVVSGTRKFYSGSSWSCMLGGGTSMDQTCSAHLTDAWSDWDLGNLEARSTGWALHCVPRAVAEPCLWCVRAHCPAGGPLTSGSVVVKRVCTWSTTVFGFPWMPAPKVSQQNIALQATSFVLSMHCFSTFSLQLCQTQQPGQYLWKFPCVAVQITEVSMSDGGWMGHKQDFPWRDQGSWLICDQEWFVFKMSNVRKLTYINDISRSMSLIIILYQSMISS